VTNHREAPGNNPRHSRIPVQSKRHVDSETERLMQNWARWKSGVRMSVAISSAYNLEAAGRYNETPLPPIDGDAILVDAVVEALPDGIKLVLTEYWVRGGRFEQKVARCRCTVSTFYRRLEDGNRQVRRGIEERRQHYARLQATRQALDIKVAR